ncbi:heme oxygenase [Dyadobacter koreensis]|uniref:Heme oxygenase n=1 Tax=Dyadobacter koreensis TaxID=408657 RepID=A0A1H6T523_9BACT|nr:biliverdin-producing heme oxygenase [Dyadobacter koreensis]SEI75229.1 heme oxygenase [Dyadobacter koreensis]
MEEIVVSKEKQDLFLKNLRKKTDESHKRLEENRYSKAILDPSVTLADYQTYIAKLYGVTRACERDIFPEIASVLPDLEERYKSGLIVKDLANTGFSRIAIDNIPVFQFTTTGIAKALGVMYVLEGSTLGGKFLYQQINHTLGLNSETGAAYFWGYGQKTGMLWKRFISSLAEFAVEENCEQEIIKSAVHTFTTIDKWLNEAEIIF